MELPVRIFVFENLDRYSKILKNITTCKIMEIPIVYLTILKIKFFPDETRQIDKFFLFKKGIEIKIRDTLKFRKRGRNEKLKEKL